MSTSGTLLLAGLCFASRCLPESSAALGSRSEMSDSVKLEFAAPALLAEEAERELLPALAETCETDPQA